MAEQSQQNFKINPTINKNMKSASGKRQINPCSKLQSQQLKINNQYIFQNIIIFINFQPTIIFNAIHKVSYYNYYKKKPQPSIIMSKINFITILMAMTVMSCLSIPNCRLQIGRICYSCQPQYSPNKDRNQCIKKTQLSASKQSKVSISSLGSQTISDDPSRTPPCNGKPSCGEVQTFKTKDQLIKNLKKRRSTAPSNGGFVGGPGGRPLILQSNTFKNSATSGSQLDFSETNNQVSSVDQADIIKTDGNFIYSISRCTLSIIKSFPFNQAGVVSTISFPQYPQGLFIEGNYLAVFGTSYTSSPYTFIYIYDVSDRTKPLIIKSFTVSGNYFQARKTKNSGTMYLLTQQYINLDNPQLPYYNTGAGNQEINLQNIFVYPDATESFLFINIAAINLKNPLSDNAFKIVSLVTEGGYILYASDYNIYITYTKYQYTNNFQSTSYTVIHAVYIDKLTMIPYADGKVQGYITNQFFMDQYKLDLRIATTQNNVQPQFQPQIQPIFAQSSRIAATRPINFNPETSNNVFVLRYDSIQGKLNIIGKIRNIAPTQTIFSCRFVGTKLHMVTFRRKDPFYVIDLSRPNNPTILGLLKIPGFSTYLHPFDENTIIGIGRDANDQGVALGLKIALFDVSVVTNPTQLTSFTLQEKYSYSTAEYQHKAFLFDKQRELLVIPGYYYDSQKNHADTFNGAFVFRITRTQIYNPVIVDHLNGDPDKQKFYERYVERSLYVENVLFTKSPCKLRLHLLPGVVSIKDVNLGCCPFVPPKNQIGSLIKT